MTEHLQAELKKNLRGLPPYGDSDWVRGLAWPTEGMDGGGRPPLSIEVLLAAAEGGVPIDLYPRAPFDLHRFGAALPSITRLRWLGPSAHIRGLDALPQMTSLTHLAFPRTKERVDLSQLPALKFVMLDGQAMLSSLGARNLKIANLSGVRSWPDSFTVPPQLTELTVDGASFPADVLSTAACLERLTVEKADQLDFAALPSWAPLGAVAASRVNELRGLGQLLNEHRLESLILHRVAHIDDPAALRSAKISHVELETCDDISGDIATALKQAHPDWFIQPPRPKRNV